MGIYKKLSQIKQELEFNKEKDPEKRAEDYKLLRSFGIYKQLKKDR